MYRYDEFDQAFVKERTAQFADQVRRRLSGELTEDEFKPLRLMNGLYLQLHAYMLRVAIPYGTLNSRQMRRLAHIARTYDKGYGHFTTRQNIQFNWPSLKDTPRILEELAEVEMHAIQTSGNCIRNVTADHFAGAAADEIADPRPYAEILRQWSSLHPEFSFLPRKFKVAITGAPHDRAAVQVHDIGLQLTRNDKGEIGFTVFVGGGLGRTPMIGRKVRDFLPEEDLLAYSEAILRVYNLYGRRDNKYKARIKILVHETGLEELKADIEAEFEKIRYGVLRLPDEEVRRIETYFAPPALEPRNAVSAKVEARVAGDAAFARFVAHNLNPHRVPGYTSITISMKPIGGIPGDVTDAQMDVIANLAEAYAFDEIRISHEQNVILPHVALDDLPEIFDVLVKNGLAEGNAGLITDIIACPGMDYCALATARSIPVAQRISERFGAPERQSEIGELKIKISGCINACGHHHVGHIGILGLEKKGEEFYQITLGGSANESASIGEIIGRGFSSDEVVDAIETLVDAYLALRQSPQETFLEVYRRVGEDPFKEALYGTD
ncbi:nitrite/sulfite reductase [Pannonibacter indicus]|uniref:Sulfite reductase, beta subunit (Hemoprotein) n=1 Tax=Pannonibacter indicus TaxID=466044 RepID=A0A0K6HU33_9HYPH|nr:nitrite/sulfite reductase [Pannonibacter indicus]CUA94409.1 Sulfite reductase, beta subunit (hemoprotein) [Pannonibacter indicus]